jgi:hypothetical protein
MRPLPGGRHAMKRIDNVIQVSILISSLANDILHQLALGDVFRQPRFRLKDNNAVQDAA